jgi:hypothetical protein
MTRNVEDPVEEVLRTDFSGTIWFGATLLSSSIVIAGLLMSGWRPADLGPAAGVWWFGAALTTIGTAGLAYAGCPVQGPNLQFDDRTKTIAIRAGLLVFAVGAIISLIAVLTN